MPPSLRSSERRFSTSARERLGTFSTFTGKSQGTLEKRRRSGSWGVGAISVSCGAVGRQPGPPWGDVRPTFVVSRRSRAGRESQQFTSQRLDIQEKQRVEPSRLWAALGACKKS
jgi:hypothetical protein